jgi:hypothetical protein
MNLLHRNTLLTVSSFVVILAAWYGWMSFTTAKTQQVEARVQQVMTASMESLVPHCPRVEMHSQGEVYYAPMVYDPGCRSQLTQQMLDSLNQDKTIPPMKITNVTMQTNFSSKEDTLVGLALVEIPLFAGFDKTIQVRSTAPSPHYPSLQ